MITNSSIELQELLTAAESGTTVISSGSRLAAYLGDAYACRKIDSGQTVWESPQISTWGAWVAERVEDLRLQGILESSPCLSSLQERALWASVIGESLGDAGVLDDVHGAAARAHEARKLSVIWRLKFDLDSAGVNADSEAWLGWNRTYARRLKVGGWRESVRDPDALSGLLRENRWSQGQPLVVTGFDELTPQQSELLGALQEAGADVQWRELGGGSGDAVLRPCSDSRTEAGQIANWVRQRVDDQPGARIGVVVPELQALRGPLEAALQETLRPGSNAPSANLDERGYNISLGTPLADQPVVHCALALLRISKPWIEMFDLAELLGSPFIPGFEKEYQARARLDAGLREDGELQVSVGRVANRAEKRGCPRFAQLMVCVQEHLHASGRRRNTAEWATLFASYLEALGWARGRSLNSFEFQAAETFRELIPLLATLQEVSARMSRNEAVEMLGRMAREQLFQPRSSGSNVQVLGVLESVGMQFDHLWVAGLHDGVWPPPAQPNPFLPVALQRERNLPRSGPERELQIAAVYMQRLLKSAGDIVLSYPLRSGDEELRCSPLVAHVFASDVVAETPVPDTWEQRIRASADAENWVELMAPTAEAGAAKGGSGLLKAQSNCPFRAFVEYRLGARELQAVDVGLNAMQRGSLVHDVLEALWKNIQSSGELLDLEEGVLLERVDTAVAAELDKLEKQFPRTVTAGFRRVEQERLNRLICDWIAVEQTRPPFRVLECEGEHTVNLAGVELRLKVDRLDELEDGRRFVIDYKTGRVKSSQWFGERPGDPQLPLYSAVIDEPVGGLAFGVLRPGELGFHGVGEDADMAPGLKAVDQIKFAEGDWHQTRAGWKAVLDRLAREFLGGHAEVSPRQFPQTCEYCPLGSICRVREKLSVVVEENGDD